MPRRNTEHQMLFQGILFILVLAVLIAMVALMYFIYGKVNKVDADLHNVKQTVNGLNTPTRTPDLKSGTSGAFNYVDENNKVAIKWPADNGLELTVNSTEDGAVGLKIVNKQNQQESNYILTMYNGFGWADYLGLLVFNGEKCDKELCLRDDRDWRSLAADRVGALNMLAQKATVGRYEVMSYERQSNCRFPTLVYVNDQSKRLYELMESCAMNSDPNILTTIFSNLTFIP